MTRIEARIEAFAEAAREAATEGVCVCVCFCKDDESYYTEQLHRATPDTVAGDSIIEVIEPPDPTAEYRISTSGRHAFWRAVWDPTA